MDTHRTDIKQQRDGGGKGEWTEMDGTYEKNRLEEMASTPATGQSDQSI